MWKALYKDGTVLEEIKDGKETLFKEIDMDKLKVFELHLSNGIYGVFLDKGTFRLCDQFIDFDDAESNLKLIYFKRIRQVLGIGIGPISKSICYHIGWQIPRTSKKRILVISKDKHPVFKDN